MRYYRPKNPEKHVVAINRYFIKYLPFMFVREYGRTFAREEQNDKNTIP